MKKISYINKAPEIMPKIDPKDIPSTHVGEEGLSGDAGSGVGRGFALPGEPVMPPMHSDQEDAPVLPERKKKKNIKKMDYEELTGMLVDLADDMDKHEDMALANFADFLIKKIAVQKSLDYSLLFRDLIIKLVESDIVNQEEALIKITKQFNGLIKMYVNLGNSLVDSKREAYQGSALKAEEYVKESR